MNRTIEDLLFGFLGYKLGSHKNNEISQEDSEGLIHAFLSQVPLDAVIDYWLEANNCDTFDECLDVATILKRKAKEIL